MDHWLERLWMGARMEGFKHFQTTWLWLRFSMNFPVNQQLCGTVLNASGIGISTFFSIFPCCISCFLQFLTLLQWHLLISGEVRGKEGPATAPKKRGGCDGKIPTLSPKNGDKSVLDQQTWARIRMFWATSLWRIRPTDALGFHEQTAVIQRQKEGPLSRRDREFEGI